jgi:5'-nucleotidase/UDP-sugar diphosphatase
MRSANCGYLEDLDLAGKLTGVDVIVGGHSHTLLGTVPIPGGVSGGPYPTVKKSAAGETVLVVQAWHWGEVLGRIKVRFDRAGRVVRWTDAAPVQVDAAVPPDPVVGAMMAAFARPVEQMQTTIVGRTDTGLGEPHATVRLSENTMANTIADAMLASTERNGSAVAFMNGGGVRASLPAGAVTYGAAVTVQPFANSVVQLDVTGAELKHALEDGVAGFPRVVGGILHPSRGSAYAIDYSRPAGERVSNVVIAGKPLDETVTYRVTFNSFTAAGGDGHATLKAARGTRYDTGIIDIEALVEYFKASSPVNGAPEGRIDVTGLSKGPGSR